MCKRIMAAQTNTEGGVPFYKIGTIGGKADAYISKDLFDEYKRKYSYPNKGEVMITCAGTVGKCVIYDGEDSYYQDSNIVWIDNPNEIISNDFLYHLLSNINWSYLNSTTIVRIYNDDLRNLKLCCPRLDEQKKIARFLSLINERIATQNKIIEDLRLLRDAIMVEHYRKCNKSELCIYDIGEPFNVMNLSKDDLTKDGSPCIIYGELFTTYGCVIENVVSHTTKSLNSTLSIKGDLLFPASTTVDALSLIAPSSINEDGIILGGDMFGIHVNEQYNSNYLSYYFNIIGKKNLAKYAKGSTIIHLHYADIQKAKIILPNKNEQEAVANLLLKVEHKLNIEQKMLINYLNTKNFLLRQMFI